MSDSSPHPRRGMKAKTIKSVLRRKVAAWAATIEDEDLRKRVEDNTIVTGGAIASMLLGEPVNDFDVYFRDMATTHMVATYYVKRFKVKNKAGIDCPIHVEAQDGRVRVVIKSAGIASEGGSTQDYNYFEARPEDDDQSAAGYVGDIMQDPGDIEDAHEAAEAAEAAALEAEEGKPEYRPVFMSSNAITLSSRLQIVLRFYGLPDEIHANYDFAHCTCYWTSWDGHLELRPAALEALLARELRYVGSRYPFCSLVRMRKFVARGWRINAGQVLKMVMQLNELDLKKPAVLEDQLTGVDVAYFAQLVSRLAERDPEKVDSAYLIEVVDRMF